MMMQESPGATGIGNISSADQFAGRYKEQQRSKINPNVDDQVLKCPRCDSPNTKFCYYNNYNLTQPRHFCKTCRRYWTKGGALRNVPIGGGCRKNKRPKQRAAASKDQNPLIIALDHHHRRPNPSPHHHHHPHPQQQQQHGEESSSPGAMDAPSNLSLLQNIWGASNSNYLDLSTAESVGLALARLQNRPNLLGPAVMQPDGGVNADRRPYSHPSGGHMATLMYENPSAILPSPSSSSAGLLAEGIPAAASNFGFAGPEPNFSNVAEDMMHWRIQQQSRMAVLQQHLAVDGNNTHNTNNNQNHNHGNSNANDNNIDLMLISSVNVNDQKYESRSADHQQQHKGKSIISNDLQAQWPAVADCLFEPHAAMAGESTSGYWYGLQQLAEN